MILLEDYEVYTTEVPFFDLGDIILRGMNLRAARKEFKMEEGGFRIEEGRIIRTNKTKGEIERHYNRRLLEVLSVVECTRTKNQKVPII